jgi:preprotein translocase subunit SecD
MVVPACGLALVACRGGDDGDDQQATCMGPRPEGAKQLTFAVTDAGGVSAAELRQAVQIVCQRTHVIGIDGAVVDAEEAGGTDQIRVLLPPGSPVLTDELQRAARLRFYNWESNVVGSPDKPIPKLADARKIANRVPGAIVIHAEPPAPGYYVIRNRPMLRNEDVVKLSQDIDVNSGEPTISLDFTPHGRLQFRKLTAQIADRTEKGETAHFVVVVDAEIVVLPEVDTASNPNGLNTGGLALIGKISEEEAKQLTAFLEIGHLPVDLTPVS